MTTLDALRSRVRLELGDSAATFYTTSVGDGETKRFTLPSKPVSSTGMLVVQFSGSSQAPVTDYTLDSNEGAITLLAPLPAGAGLVVTGTAYTYFSDANLDLFLETALIQHLHNRAGVNLANLPPVEDYLVVLLASIQALWALLNDAAFDIDISTPEGVHIPRSQRYHQLLQMIELRQGQYKELASALNVGLMRIEMFSLRRVSRTTNRLVPVYEVQEVEDTRPPRRLMLPIDTLGGDPEPDSVPDADIVLVMGEAFVLQVVLNADLSGLGVRATLRRYKDSAAWFSFAVLITDLATGALTVSMDANLTRFIGGGQYWWDIQLTDGINPPSTQLEGRVDVERRSRT